MIFLKKIYPAIFLLALAFTGCDNIIGTDDEDIRIHGQITRADDNTPVQGVTVSLFGIHEGAEIDETTMTGGSGQYEFMVAPGGGYGVEFEHPEKDLVFDPPEAFRENVQEDLAFNSEAIEALYLEGVFIDEQAQSIGLPEDSVDVYLYMRENGIWEEQFSNWADENGAYSFRVIPGESYRVRPESDDWLFEPEEYTYEEIENDKEEEIQGIEAVILSGWIRRDLTTDGVEDVMVHLGSNVPEFDSRTDTTDFHGEFEFQVWKGEDYTVTPESDEYNFDPESQSFTNVQEHKSEIDFIAEPMEE